MRDHSSPIKTSLVRVLEQYNTAVALVPLPSCKVCKYSATLLQIRLSMHMQSWVES
jgi:hypothetical protein